LSARHPKLKKRARVRATVARAVCYRRVSKLPR
jgi:hypothetical protein